MVAFITSLPTPLCRHARQHSNRPHSRTCPRPQATLEAPEERTLPRFSRDDPRPPQKSLLEPSPPPSTLSPNDRVQQQVLETMRALGLSDTDQSSAPPPRAFSPIDVSRVHPLSALVGSFGAAGISYAVWSLLQFTVLFFASHPPSTDVYVVTRITAVVRTVLVCLFALGSGISGVTSLGLLMLSFRTAYGRVTGEFEPSKQ